LLFVQAVKPRGKSPFSLEVTGTASPSRNLKVTLASVSKLGSNETSLLPSPSNQNTATNNVPSSSVLRRCDRFWKVAHQRRPPCITLSRPLVILRPAQVAFYRASLSRMLLAVPSCLEPEFIVAGRCMLFVSVLVEA
jgi:hypothetical protein